VVDNLGFIAMAHSSLKANYEIFAKYYDQMAAEPRPVFNKARQRIIGRLLRRVRSACDLCAGTGTSALELARSGGVRVFAVDRSPAMCRVARAKVRRAGLPVEVIQADMRSFRLPEPVELITCEFDAINHLERKCDLERVARAVARALVPGGYFYVDMNTRRAFQELWGISWVRDGPGFFVASHGGYDARRDKGHTAFEWFIPQGRLWRRYTERYEEVCWSDSEVRRAFRSAGLEIVGTWDLFQFVPKYPWAKPGCRLFYLARKQPAG
jgi:SAM-dependent methyltransferase